MPKSGKKSHGGKPNLFSWRTRFFIIVFVFVGSAFFLSYKLEDGTSNRSDKTIALPSDVTVPTKLTSFSLQVVFSSTSTFQGGTILAQVSHVPSPIRSVTFHNRSVPFFFYGGDYRIVVPALLSYDPGVLPLSIHFEDSSSYEELITITSGRFPVVTLDIPSRIAMTPAQLTQHLNGNQMNLREILKVSNDEVLFDTSFALPLSSYTRIGSPYGEIRKTGDQIIRHLGVDFAAPLGTPVLAINSGKIHRAYYDQVYGNSVIIDHGKGIFSLYLHLQNMSVKEGDFIGRGAVVGALGETGYATSPHLHLSVKIGTESIDPLAFIEAFQTFD